jgi:hypothetical protein
VALVIVVATTGVLGTIAVLMTRNPDAPLGGTPPRRLSVPIHFAPVTTTQAAPCPGGVSAVVDETGRTCYVVARGVDVTAVQKIEAVAERDGTYAVRVALAPAFREQVRELTKETLEQQIVIVVGDRLVAAPRVAQAITTDSLVIAGSFTKEQADALVTTLLGTPGAQVPVVPPATEQSPPDTGTGDGAPDVGATSPGGAPTGGPGTDPTGGAGTGPAGGVGDPTGAPAVNPTGGGQAGGGANPRGEAPATGSGTSPDPRFASCKEAIAAGYGPYFKETHEEYHYYVDRDNDGVACDSDDL